MTDDRPLKGRTAVIVGAGGGIGRAIALRLHQQGAQVTAAGRDESRLAETVSLSNGAITARRCDIADAESITALESDLLREHGGLDILVCNSAIGANASMHETTTKQLDQIIATNVRGTYLCLQWAPG